MGAGGTLDASTLTSQVTKLTLVSYNATSNAKSTRDCPDPIFATQIKDLIVNATKTAVAAASVLATVGCKDSSGSTNTWRVRKCVGAISASICIGCRDPCGVDKCPSLQTLSPCGATGYGCSARKGGASMYRILSAAIKPLAPAPGIALLDITGNYDGSDRRMLDDGTGMNIWFNLASADDVAGGTVYCAAFTANEAPRARGRLNESNVADMGIA